MDGIRGYAIPALAGTFFLAAAGTGSGQETAGATGAADGGGEGTTMTVPLSASADGGIRGTATITRADPAENPRVHRILLELAGAEVGRTYSAVVGAGRCHAPGRVLVRLANVSGREGFASSSTIVTGDMLVGAAGPPGPLFIRVRAPDGKPVACGDIPESIRLARRAP